MGHRYTNRPEENALMLEKAEQEEKNDAELSRLTVPSHIPERIRRLSQRTGAAGTWHRRRAIEEYLERNGEPKAAG